MQDYLLYGMYMSTKFIREQEKWNKLTPEEKEIERKAYILNKKIEEEDFFRKRTQEILEDYRLKHGIAFPYRHVEYCIMCFGTGILIPFAGPPKNSCPFCIEHSGLRSMDEKITVEDQAKVDKEREEKRAHLEKIRAQELEVKARELKNVETKEKLWLALAESLPNILEKLSKLLEQKENSSHPQC